MRSRDEIRSEAEWSNWIWQMQNRVHSPTDLGRYIHPTQDELRAIEETRDIFRWNITPYYAHLMDPEDAECPIRRQVVPRTGEMDADIIGTEDPLEEVAHSPVKNLIHNYRDRVAFCVTAECAIYCRYCLRKRMVGDAGYFLNRAETEDAIAYLAAHPEIRDVLLTGGDPLIFSDENLDWLLTRLRSIPHIEIIRIGSRLPVTLPQRITPALCDVLKQHHPVWLNTHFNHPKELTAEVAEAVNRLLDAGIPVGNQTVLLKGINDDVSTLRQLLEGLIRYRIRPYYLYQAQLIGGTAHFRTSIEKGLQLMKQLQGRTTGFAIPKYVLDTPFGKVPLNRSFIQGRSGDHVIVESYSGKLWAEPNPVPDDEKSLTLLPEIPFPENAHTVPTNPLIPKTPVLQT